jgi:hypothetical protein
MAHSGAMCLPNDCSMSPLSNAKESFLSAIIEVLLTKRILWSRFGDFLCGRICCGHLRSWPVPLTHAAGVVRASEVEVRGRHYDNPFVRSA